MTNWDDLAKKVCEDRGLKLLSLVSEGWYFFVENSEGRRFPLPESRLAAWIEQERAEHKEKVEAAVNKAVEKNDEALKRLADS